MRPFDQAFANRKGGRELWTRGSFVEVEDGTV